MKYLFLSALLLAVIFPGSVRAQTETRSPFDPTSDPRVVLRIDHQSKYYADAGGKIPAVAGGEVKSIRDSTGNFTAVIDPGSNTAPILSAVKNGTIKLVGIGKGWAMTLGQPPTLMSLLDNGLKNLAEQTASPQELTVLGAGTPASEGFFLAKTNTPACLGTIGMKAYYGNGLSGYYSSPYDASPKSFGFTVGPYHNPAFGVASSYCRGYFQGAPTETPFPHVSPAVPTDITIGGFRLAGKSQAEPSYQLTGDFFICSYSIML